MYMGCPQNLDSNSLLILIRFTHRVSAGTVTGGITFVSFSVSGALACGSQCTRWTSLNKFPGDMLNRWPSH